MVSRIRAAVILLMIAGVIVLAVDYALKVTGTMFHEKSYIKYKKGNVSGQNVEQDFNTLMQGKGHSDDEVAKAKMKKFVAEQTMKSFMWIAIILVLGGLLLVVFKEPKALTDEEFDAAKDPFEQKTPLDNWDEDLSEMEGDPFKKGLRQDRQDEF